MLCRNSGMSRQPVWCRNAWSPERSVPYFERPTADHILLREQAIETRLNGEWISGVIDRAVVMTENGSPQTIQVIDFKTDTGETAESLRSKYQPQLKLYRQALATIYGVSEKNINCHLLSTSLQEMVDVL